MKRQRPSWVAHMTLRQLILLVASVSAVLALIFVDGRSTVAQIDEVEGTKQEVAMPYVSAANMLATSWFCPGVPGNDDSIASAIAIANPSDADITATVTLLSNGQAPVSSSVSVPARSKTLVDARGGISSPFVSALVEILGSVGTVEQLIGHPAGSAVTLCANRPSAEWYFADGFTGADSIEQIVLTNPFSDATVVDISFVTSETERTPANLQGFVIPPQSVITLSMDEQGARNEPVLAVSVRASSGMLVAGRSQHYLGQGRLGYSMSLGASALSTQWSFPDGEKIDGNSEQLVIYNPTKIDRSLSVVFVNGADSANSLEPAVVTAPAGRVTVLNTANIPGLPSGYYGIVISANDLVDGGGVVVEQVINRRVGNSVGTSVLLGAPIGAASTVWSAPSGVSAGLVDSLVVLNATPVEGFVTVSQVGPAGIVALSGLESVPVPASGVVVIAVPAGLPQSEIVIQSTVQVVVQRLLSRGNDLVGRAAVLALPHLPSPDVSK